jgi:hypothetical protein
MNETDSSQHMLTCMVLDTECRSKIDEKTNDLLVLCVNRSNFFSTSPPGSVEVHQRFKREDGDEERR